eukprot:535241-Hanusia_phi.AAC.1
MPSRSRSSSSWYRPRLPSLSDRLTCVAGVCAGAKGSSQRGHAREDLVRCLVVGGEISFNARLLHACACL